MKSSMRMRGPVFWLVCALSVLLPGIAAGLSSSGTDFTGVRQAQAGLKTRLYESHAGLQTRLSGSQPGLRTRLYAETAPGHRHVDSADADSESGERVATCALLAALHISQRAPRLEDCGPRIDRGTRASRRLALGPRFAPRPPPAPLHL